MKKIVILCLVFVLVPCAAFAVPVVLDSFDNGTIQQTLLPSPQTTFNSGLPAGTALYDTRVLVSTLVNTSGGTMQNEVNIGAGSGGLFSFNAQAGVTGQAIMIWDGNTDGTFNPGATAATDFTAGGNSSIGLRFGEVDQANTIKLFFYDGTNTVGVNIQLAPIATATTIFIPYSNWAGIDFTKIHGAELVVLDKDLTVSSTLYVDGLDFTMDFMEGVTTVPEPSTLLLLGAGLLGLGITARARRKS